LDSLDDDSLPDIAMESEVLLTKITCPLCGKCSTVNVDSVSYFQRFDFRCQSCEQLVQHKKFELDAIRELSKIKRDSRENDVFNLYRFINSRLFNDSLPIDPSTVLAVCSGNEILERGVTHSTVEHPRKFKYIILSKVHLQTYSELYSTLVHELVHVIAHQLDSYQGHHGPPFVHHRTT